VAALVLPRVAACGREVCAEGGKEGAAQGTEARSITANNATEAIAFLSSSSSE